MKYDSAKSHFSHLSRHPMPACSVLTGHHGLNPFGLFFEKISKLSLLSWDIWIKFRDGNQYFWKEMAIWRVIFGTFPMEPCGACASLIQ